MPRAANASGSASEVAAPEPRQTRYNTRRGTSPTPESSAEQLQTGPGPRAPGGKKNVQVSVEGFDPVPRRGAPRPKAAERDLLSQVTVGSGTDGTGSQIIYQDPSQDVPMSSSDSLEQEASAQRQDAALADTRALALLNLSLASDQLKETLVSPLKSDTNDAWITVHTISRDAFAAVRKLYLGEDDSLIEWSRISKSLKQDIRWKAQGVMTSANVTTLMDSLTNIGLGWEEPINMFDRLDLDFPQPFLPWTHGDPETAKSELTTDEHIQMAFEIRTQRLIATLHKVKGKTSKNTPITVAANIFCGVTEPAEALDSLRNGPFVGLFDEHADPETSEFKIAQTRAHSILSKIEGSRGFSNVIKALEATYPMKSFLSSMSSWAVDHFDGIQKALRDGRGEDKQRAPSPSLFVRDAEERRDASDSPRTPPAADDLITKTVLEGGLFKGPASVRHLKSKANSKNAPPPSNQEQNPRRSAAGTAKSSSGANVDSGVEPSVGLSPGSRNTNQTRRSESVVTDTPILSQLPTRVLLPKRNQQGHQSVTPELGTSSGARGRQATVLEDDAEGEDEFETDTRNPDARKRAADAAAMPPPKRPRTTTASDQPSSRHDESTDNNERAARDEEGDRFNWNSITQQNRLSGSTQASSTQSSSRRQPAKKFPQQRTPWSDRDIRLLIRYVDAKNCNWAGIAAFVLDLDVPADMRFEHPRDQQALRDKARNLKVDMLKGDLPLLPGFDGVALGKKERQILIDRGKNPDRREQDIVNGQPTFTQYHDDQDDS